MHKSLGLSNLGYWTDNRHTQTKEVQFLMEKCIRLKMPGWARWAGKNTANFSCGQL